MKVASLPLSECDVWRRHLLRLELELIAAALCWLGDLSYEGSGNSDVVYLCETQARGHYQANLRNSHHAIRKAIPSSRKYH